MEYNKRASIRRQKKENSKIMNAKGKSEEVLMRKAFLAGKNEGMELAVGIIFLALHEHYNFGTKRLMRLMEHVSTESRKMNELPTQFNVDWYIKELYKKCDIKLERASE